MNFFKSILTEDPESRPSASQANDFSQEPDHGNPIPNPSTDDASGGWSFGGLIKTFAARSESVLETYSRDLKEFGSGLRSETDHLREVASRAVKELPASLEAGASAAHGSLESVSHALDEVIKSTAGIISKERLVFVSDGESETLDTKRSLDSGGHCSWFESQLSMIQNDVNIFCQEPDGEDEYNEWKLGFDLGEKKGEMEKLIGDNGALEGVYKRVVVPGAVDPQTFWCRYFYRVHKLEQQDRLRANLVKRENPGDDEEELSWDVDDDDNGDGGIQQKTGVEVDGSGSAESRDRRTLNLLANQAGTSSRSHDGVDKDNAIESSSNSDRTLSLVEKVRSDDVEVKVDQKKTSEGSGVKKDDDLVLPLDEKLDLGEKGESSKKNYASAKVNEEDLEWDEIEDIGSGDEKKISAAHGGNTNRAELRKRLSAAVDDENLSWDIEDEDEPVTA